ncbi:MAG TPA: cytochrome P450 [Candidimonas sp.]|nr:cytochrome P450 [Candidimonas sp.]
MYSKLHPDWDPRAEAVLDDQIAGYDDMRKRCPVAHSEYLGWSLFRHADVVRVLHDHETFSNAASGFLSVPNGMDPPLHTGYRQIVDTYFAASYIDAFAPACRAIAQRLVQALPRAVELDFMAKFAQDFSLEIQSAFLGWPARLHEPLRLWIEKNRRATLARDRDAMAAIAFEFDAYIKEMLDIRREASDQAPDDITTRLLSDRVDGRLLTDDEIVSILRNWTVGELSTIASCVGILAHYLAANQPIQDLLRSDLSLLPGAIDEILRMHAPLIANRRVTTIPAEVGGKQLNAGERLTVMWASANRDEEVFGDPDEFRLDRDPALNLLYGAGVHVCPGAPLARLELTVVMEELLGNSKQLSIPPGTKALNAVYPASGFSVLPLRID